MNKRNAKQNGFSLIELIVVISIITILISIIVGVYLSAKGRRDEKKVRAELKAIELAIHNYHTQYSFYPPDSYDPDELPENFDPKMNGLFESLTQGFSKNSDGNQKKNFLEGANLSFDKFGNLLAPVNNPNGHSTNNWQYNTHDPTHNPKSYDLWVPVNVSGEILNVGNWEN